MSKGRKVAFVWFASPPGLLPRGLRYQEYEEAKVADLKQRIANLDETQGLKKSVFDRLLEKIYKRSK